MPTEPEAPAPQVVVISAAAGSATRIDETENVDVTYFCPCRQQLIHMTGVVRVRGTMVTHADGTSVLNVRSDLSVTQTSVSTGATWRVVGTETFQERLDRTGTTTLMWGGALRILPTDPHDVAVLWNGPTRLTIDAEGAFSVHFDFWDCSIQR